ncbi:hypothetical protein [Thioalkalivibrio sp. ALgr3]|uniref:hypothetical protein n=1 Tax=Thioalkalivibrio sp. ALgr3 TaxID=1239292 RepID=UPI00036E6F61|nr:hypothetical protein [Thioalkalivibrio sp. ALgr3]
MGIFRGIKSTYRKIQAAALIENLLREEKENGNFEGDPQSTATGLVRDCWDILGELLSGKMTGGRPHKVVIAAQSLAKAIEDTDASDPNYTAYGMALSRLLQAAEDHQVQLGLTAGDFGVFDEAFRTLKNQQDELSELL